MKPFLAALFLLIVSSGAAAQERTYLVQFRHKGGTPHSLAAPETYLSPRALTRRQRLSILVDSTDLPIPPAHLQAVASAGATLLNPSRWLNQVSVRTADPAALDRIRQLPFVLAAEPIAATPRPGADSSKLRTAAGGEERSLRTASVAENRYDYGSAIDQVQLHRGAFLHNIGLRGQGVVIGVLDAGFLNYLAVPSLDSLRKRGGILSTWDFVAGEASVNEDNSHGMQCLSVMAALLPGQFVGTAPEALYHLFRSEDAASEYPVEEHNWVCAAERLDSAGGDLISSSLGYYHFDNPAFNHSYADMDGQTTMAAIGADLAAKKGILVVNSAGNEGNNSWHYIITPADGDSVLAVGAVNRAGRPAPFTSFGPSADRQVKPDVASLGVGTIVQFANGSIGGNNGTSFAAPNIAGLAAALRQGFPERSAIDLIRALRAAGDQAAAPDDSTGYGIPDMRKAVGYLVRQHGSLAVAGGDCAARLTWTTKDHGSMRHFVERRGPGETGFTVIGEVRGYGAVFGERTYEFTDERVPGGSVAYRIRQLLDPEDSFSVYLDTVIIQTAACAPTGSITLFPNPGGANTFLRIDTGDEIPNAQLTIRNAAGQLLYHRTFSKPAGTFTVALPNLLLPDGVYLVSLYNGKALLFSEKLLK